MTGQTTQALGWGTLGIAVLLSGALGCSRATTAAESTARTAESTAASMSPASMPPSKAGPRAAETENVETAVLAGGCFWGMQDLIRDIPGVIDTEVGYAGGTLASPTYEDVKQGSTGHAESVKVRFDPRRLSYGDLLEKWFFRMHDPTTKNQQGNDKGSQYRSAIFTTSPEQKKIAAEVIKRVSTSGKWKAPIVTQVVDAGPFTSAEGYHQDYLEKNPGGYTCHYMREWDDV